MNKKAVAMISGGLDSTLAAKVMLNQGIELTGIYLSAPWGCCDKTVAMKSAHTLGIPFLVIKMTDEYIGVIRKPKYGYGSSMNPCIDCRIYMFEKVKEIMERTGASFLVTGEVLGQRPMSQMRPSMLLIEEQAGLKGLVVRPLSAKVLEPSLPEIAGVVDREKLHGITGRSRKPQMELAMQLGIMDYPNPAGGCLLTDELFGLRVKDLFDHQDKIDLEDMELLRFGRHFRPNASTKLIVGRNEGENGTLQEYLAPGRVLFQPDRFPAPSVLLVGPPDDNMNTLALRMISHYTKPEKRPADAKVFMKIGVPRGEDAAPMGETILLNESITDDELEKMKVG